MSKTGTSNGKSRLKDFERILLTVFLENPGFTQFVACRSIQSMVGGALIWLGAVPCHAELPSGWSGLDLGGPTAGLDAYSNGVYTVTGAGIGLGSTNDQMHFTCQTLDAGGNFRLTVRVASFTGGAGSEVGLVCGMGRMRRVRWGRSPINR